MTEANSPSAEEPSKGDEKRRKHIRRLEMTQGKAPRLNMEAVRASQDVLQTLQDNPTFVRVVQRSAEGTEWFSLEIRDPQLGPNVPEEEGNARAEFYIAGLRPLMAHLASHFPGIPKNAEFEMVHNDHTGKLILRSNIGIDCARPGSEEVEAHIHTFEPVHILAKFLAENGVNFPGAANFMALGKNA